MPSDIDDKVKHREHGARFHMAIAQISGNHLSKLFVSALFELLGELRPDSIQTMRFKQESYTLHKSIIEALAAKDADLCEYLMAKDIERTGTLEMSRIKKGRTKLRLKKSPKASSKTRRRRDPSARTATASQWKMS